MLGLTAASDEASAPGCWLALAKQLGLQADADGECVRVSLGQRSSAIALEVAEDRQGELTFLEFQQRRGRFALPDTLTVLGASSRRYLYFSIPADVTVPSTVDGLGIGIDVRGEGARAPWPASVDSTGQPYRFCAESPLALAPLPGDVLRRLQKRARPGSSAAARLEQSEAPHHDVARARAEALGRVRVSSDVSTLSLQALLLGRLVGLGYLDLTGTVLDLAAAAQHAQLDPSRR